MAENSFPFGLDNVIGWIVRRKDGTILRFEYVDPKALTTGTKKKDTSFFQQKSSVSSHKSYSEWCDHTPSIQNPPIFQSDGIALYIADSVGARRSYTQFDVAIDGGGVLMIDGEYDLPILYGDPSVRRGLDKFVSKSSYQAKEKTKILKIRWPDRAPAPVKPEFWPALLARLQHERDEKRKQDPEAVLNVVTICQGGHGRSGSALVCLMMCMTDYSPLDALTHIRALHCARAIESKDQHVYLNHLAEFLGREPDALDAEEVKSFKDRFLTLSSPWAEPYQDRVRGGKGAGERTRGEAYI